jgi:hypothetical protein
MADMKTGRSRSSRSAIMDDELINRVTIIQRTGETPEPVIAEKEPRRRRKTSVLTRPFERAARRLIRAHIIFGQEVLRRHNRANRRRSDGWLLEGPAIIIESSRRAYNEARKVAPFRILPKA